MLFLKCLCSISAVHLIKKLSKHTITHTFTENNSYRKLLRLLLKLFIEALERYYVSITKTCLVIIMF